MAPKFEPYDGSYECLMWQFSPPRTCAEVHQLHRKPVPRHLRGQVGNDVPAVRSLRCSHGQGRPRFRPSMSSSWSPRTNRRLRMRCPRRACSARVGRRDGDERRVRPRRAAVFRLEPGARVRAKFREGWALGRIVERSERTWMVKYDDGEMRDDVSDYLLKEPQEPTLPGDGLSGGSESPLPVLNATPSALPIHPDEPDVSAASIAAALSFEAGVQAQTEPRLFHNYALSGKLYESSLGGNSRKLSFVEALSQCAVPLPNKPHTHNDARLEAAWRAGDEDAFKERRASWLRR